MRKKQNKKKKKSKKEIVQEYNKQVKKVESKIKDILSEYRADENYKIRYNLFNGVLYNLCKKHIAHNDLHEVVAKICLIGRAYSASVERTKKKKKDKTDFFYDKIGKIFINHKDQQTQFAKTIDGVIKKLNKSNKLFAYTQIKQLLLIHKKFIDKIFNITKNKKHSFVSKYLHFHCKKNVYLYDSRAKESINRIVNKQSEIVTENKVLKLKKKFDKEYYYFLAKMSVLINALKKLRVSWTPREIDKFLLWYNSNKVVHKKRKKKKKNKNKHNKKGVK